MSFDRSSGVLLHITSLPSYAGIGDFGPAAFAFADFLAAAKQRLWQVLPLNPTGYGSSPYAAMSAFAGNPLLVSLEYLSDWGWIEGERIAGLAGRSGNVDFGDVDQRKLPLLAEAAKNFIDRKGSRIDGQWQEFEAYCRENSSWLDDYARYAVIRVLENTGAWTKWPEPLRKRDHVALIALDRLHHEALLIEKALQFAFDVQWRNLRRYCAEREIRFVGDVAIFVNMDSADVWIHPDLFELDEHLHAIRVAGVPPDYFSVTGQRWGNPLYRWDVLQKQNFNWWVERIRRARSLYDLIRLDHFRGFEAYWAIPAEDDTAINGQWVKAPGHELFASLRTQLGELPFIAEDLGLITPEVDELRLAFAMPGMRILQFGFSGRGAHEYLPHRYVENTVVYTGTHDNDTTQGWWNSGATDTERQAVETYIGPVDGRPVWPLMRLASTSVANICLFPMQDLLEIGSEGRMNTPASADANWSWRCPEHVLTPELAERLATLTELSDRDGLKLAIINGQQVLVNARGVPVQN